MEVTCEDIYNLTADDVWGILEGTSTDDSRHAVNQHCLNCLDCLKLFGRMMNYLSDTEPQRYRIYRLEHLSMKKAELLRYCRANNIEIDLTTIKTSEDYLDAIVKATRSDDGVYEAWKSKSSTDKQDILIKILKSMRREQDENS